MEKALWAAPRDRASRWNPRGVQGNRRAIRLCPQWLLVDFGTRACNSGTWVGERDDEPQDTPGRPLGQSLDGQPCPHPTNTRCGQSTTSKAEPPHSLQARSPPGPAPSTATAPPALHLRISPLCEAAHTAVVQPARRPSREAGSSHSPLSPHPDLDIPPRGTLHLRQHIPPAGI